MPFSQSPQSVTDHLGPNYSAEMKKIDLKERSFVRSPAPFSVTDMLAARRGEVVNSYRRGWTPTQLSSSIAWNPSRMRNMILAVGPGTPASVCWKSENDEDEDEWSSSQGIMLQDSDDDNWEEHVSVMETASEEKEEEEESQMSVDHEEEKSDSDSDNSDDTERLRHLEQAGHDRQASLRELGLFRLLHRRIAEAQDGDDSDDSSEIQIRRPRLQRRQQEPRRAWSPSIRHGGCINTACWLDSPWRLSTVSASPSTLDSSECPTQLITSGDDRLVKFWDVRNAMGSASPMPGGWDTFCPLACAKNENEIGTSLLHKEWRDHYNRDNPPKIAGSVNLLATLTSGHRGNVFHVTPVDCSPGKVLTCAADGYLRVSDLQSETSSVVVNPFVNEDGDFVYHSRMAFSHLMLTADTGLLCSERGLHHFDLRLSPRQQQHQSLLSTLVQKDDQSYSTFRTLSCKACAAWSPHCSTETTLIFAGGSSEYVELLDLRNGSGKKAVLQRYKPRGLEEDGKVSVSGLDVSKDGRELLVSYESDQIYSFPVFHESSRARPTLDEIDAAGSKFTDDRDSFIPELMSYGGHLNRFTFLKNARYAGPKDDYIITGSDSGNAWMYERKSGTVVSLLSADASTCNGVIPHPSLPFFITYGIDSTAKLWRAATCVDPTMSDSPSARAKASLELPYEMSPVCRTYDGVQALVRRIDDEPAIMPDFVASSEEIAGSGSFSSQTGRGINGENSPKIGNALRNLPMLLRQNRYECYRAHHDSRIVPIEQPLEHFTHRVSQHRLHLQADRLGVKWNALSPWAFTVPENLDVHPADLVPDSPSDWILFDKQMKENPLDVQMNVNLKDYEDVLRRSFPDDPAFFDRPEGDLVNKIPWLNEKQQSIEETDTASPRTSVDCVCRSSSLLEFKSRKLLYETALLLKEGGNQAVSKGCLNAAARRYDKAIQYCAVAFMQYHEGMTNLKHLTVGHHVEAAALKSGDQVRPSNVVAVWSPLLRILITSRLNMSLLLLKPEFALPSRAADQARAALKLLFPFTRHVGKIVVILSRAPDKKKEHVVSDEETVETYKEAKSLQAKAYFRLGSAEFNMGDYAAAIKSFEASLKSSSVALPNSKPDSLLMRRLQEAKQKSKAKKKRDRKKFQKLMGEGSSTADPDEYLLRVATANLHIIIRPFHISRTYT